MIPTIELVYPEHLWSEADLATLRGLCSDGEILRLRLTRPGKPDVINEPFSIRYEDALHFIPRGAVVRRVNL